jgi:uncharacterized membrane protein
MKAAQKILSKEEENQIKEAIAKAEKASSGEIRLHIENRCKGESLDRAAWLFKKLNMHKTELRNGVLFYLAVKDHKFAILGDGGINKVTPDDFWDTIKDQMETDFKEGHFADGLAKGIEMAGQELKQHFPYQADDKNELSDEVSYGE